jgi:threonine/homoserine/homoserine lactone efflux protein
MVPLKDSLLFAGTALVMVLTPGPNMIYLVSRSICQGRRAGVISLLGVGLGLLLHMLAASAGLSALFVAIPMAYGAVKLAGAGYLLYLAWQAVRPGARSPFEARQLPEDPPHKLVLMGFLTCVLNPKVAVLYLSIFPQFISPDHGSIFLQGIQLGFTQILVGMTGNLVILLSAAHIAARLSAHPRWLLAQRYVMGTVLGGLALRLAIEPQRAVQVLR